MVTWSCLGFLSELVPTSTSVAWSLIASYLRRLYSWYCFPCPSENWYLEVGETYIKFCGHVLLRCCLRLFFQSLNIAVGVSCWMSPSASWAPGFVPIRVSCRLSSTSCSCFYLNSNHCLFSMLQFDSTKVRHTRAAVAADPLEFEVSRCITSQFARSFLPVQVRM